MRRTALLGVVVCAGFTGCATVSSTPAQSEPSEPVTVESIQSVVETRGAAIEACYEDYVRTFGGKVAGESEMTPADDGPTQLYGEPWEGELTFRLELARGAADVVLVDSSTEGDAEHVPPVSDKYTPPPSLVTCIIGQLETASWPTTQTGIQVKKSYAFQTGSAKVD